MALKQIKSKIKATQRTSKVTKAMEAVSAVKMRKSQERALLGRPFAMSALRILENISKSTSIQRHTLFTHDVGTHECVIVITSDKGLAGSLNSSVLKEATELLTRQNKNQCELVCFGKKAYEHYTRRGYTIAQHFINVRDEVSIDDMEAVASQVIQKFTNGTYHTVSVVYQNFLSTFEQKARTRQILPIDTAEVSKMIHDILPRTGKYSDNEEVQKNVVYTTEQSDTNLYDGIFRSIVEIMLYHALLESKASEHSARMVAMKNATDKAKEVTKALTLLYNKERQSVITAEVSEITGGIEALKN